MAATAATAAFIPLISAATPPAIPVDFIDISMMTGIVQFF